MAVFSSCVCPSADRTVQEIVQESGDTNALLTLLSAEMSHREKIWAADTIAAVCEGVLFFLRG